MKGTHARPQPQPRSLDFDRADLEARIQRAHEALLRAQDWPARARRWQYMRRLLLQRRSPPASARDLGGPERARAIVNRVMGGLLLGWETRSTRQ
jgi:hypothetical protein